MTERARPKQHNARTLLLLLGATGRSSSDRDDDGRGWEGGKFTHSVYILRFELDDLDQVQDGHYCLGVDISSSFCCPKYMRG